MDICKLYENKVTTKLLYGILYRSGSKTKKISRLNLKNYTQVGGIIVADKNKKMLVIQKIMKQPETLTVFSVATNMPLVECNEESFNDQVYIFENEDALKEFAKSYADKKIPLRGVKYAAEDRMKFFTTLLCINVDEIVYIDALGKFILKVSDIVKKNDFSKLPKEQRPIENPSLQLSGIYFAQEASRPVPNEEKTNLKELEEELAVNMVKSTYIVAVDFLEGPESETEKMKNAKFRLPLLKTKNDDIYQPIFTDNIELAKYNKENKCKAIAVPFANLEKLLVPQSKGFMLNPNGYHLLMPKELLQGLKARFGVESPKPAQDAANDNAQTGLDGNIKLGGPEDEINPDDGDSLSVN